MAKNSNRKLLCIAIILTILLSSSAYANLTPNAHATEIIVQQKGLTILNDVVGLDMAKYNTASKEGPQDSYLGVVPQENVRYTLESNGSKIDALYTFTNGKLRMIHVLESEGSPRLTAPATKTVQLGNTTIQVIDVPETAKFFLNDYHSYSGNSFYGDLASMLEHVDAKENLTKTSGNVKLEITVSGGSTTFKWTYTFNGIDAPSKCVALGYKDGFLKYFIDNWDLYKIGSTTVNLSEQEAVDIAMERARTFSWNMSSDNDTVKITNFKVTNAMIWENVFCSNLYADQPRSEDPLMLYPVRHVWVSLDKFYPGNVYGIEVYLWADTKDIAHIQERFSTLDPPVDLVATSDDYTVQLLSGQSVNEIESNYLLITWATFPVFAGIMLGVIPVWFLLSKKKNLPKSFCKIGGILLCVLVFSTIALVPIAKVNAESTRGALIFGSRSDGAMTEGQNPYHWRKTANELTRQGTTSNAISNYFRDDGYATENHQGNPGSLHYNVLNEIDITADQHSLVAIVDFDHGVGGNISGEFHYMFEDNNGTYFGPPPIWEPNAPWNGVYDYEIRQRTDDYNPSKYFFAFINTCMSANTTNPYTGENWQGPGTGNARAMPYAFTGRLVTAQPNSTPPSGYMSRNGYTHPDSGAFAYIGFPFGSAALSQTITGISPLYATWLENFLWYALSFDISVNNALDEATLSNFNSLFGNSALATGFTAQWPRDDNGDGTWEPHSGPGSTLALYGNGNIHLYEYFVHDVVDYSGWGWWAVTNPENIEGGSTDGNYAVLQAQYYWLWGMGIEGQAMIVGSIGWEATGHIYLNGYSAYGYASPLQVWVSYDFQNWYQVGSEMTITQTSPYWIDVGTYSGKFRYIAVVVYCDSWGEAANLYADSVLVIPSPPQSEYYWVYSATEYEYYNGRVFNVESITGSYHDGNSAHIGCPNYPDRAEIVGVLNEEVVGGGQVEIYGCSAPGGYYSDMYVYVSSNQQDWVSVGNMTITATSPYWIDVGTCGSSFRYIKIVGHDTYNSVALNLDCVRVTP